jgi:hypothetical protein
VKIAAALLLFALAQFSALIVSFFCFAAAAFAGDQRDPAMYGWAAAGILVLATPAAGFGVWWWRKQRSREGLAQPDNH